MAKVLYSKSFISYPDQIALLKSRGMKFADEKKSLHLLENISYYRFSGYWYPLLADKENHVFKPNADFDTAFNLYKFDCELRKLIIAELEKIEVAVRAKMAIQDELNRNDEEFIIAFKSKYTNHFPPSYILLEITSFGALSRLYGNLKSGKNKRDIARTFGLSDVAFTSWLHSLVYIRNVCAHHARIWNRPMSIQPLFPRSASNAWLTNRPVGINRVFYALSMIIYLLNIINRIHIYFSVFVDYHVFSFFINKYYLA
jgi:abortive infection bacteriophage resistance protein